MFQVTLNHTSNFLCQQMHFLLKHKMLQLTLKISLYVGSYMFWSVRTIIREHMPKLTKVTGFVEIISKNAVLWQYSAPTQQQF
jgi:hypothetical protein